MTGPDPHESAVAYPLERDVLIVAGPDAPSYLQGQLSQDVEALSAGDCRWTFVLAPTGKVDAWFRVSRREHDFVLDVDAGSGGPLEARLRRFLLRTDATVEPVAWPGVALRGPGATDHGTIADRDATVVADPAWPGIEGLDLLGPAVTAPPTLPDGRPSDLDVLRIEAGVPAMGRELDDTTIPAATGVVERSVSFTKGCFTGQELVARMESRGGLAPTRLAGVLADPGGSIEPGDALHAGGGRVGAVTSVARSPWRGTSVGLAYVKRAVEVPARAQAPDGGAVELVALPFD